MVCQEHESAYWDGSKGVCCDKSIKQVANENRYACCEEWQNAYLYNNAVLCCNEDPNTTPNNLCCQEENAYPYYKDIFSDCATCGEVDCCTGTVYCTGNLFGEECGGWGEHQYACCPAGGTVFASMGHDENPPIIISYSCCPEGKTIGEKSYIDFGEGPTTQWSRSCF